MTFKNFVRTWRAFCRRQPFRSFQVELVSGTVILVTHPEAMILRGEVFVYTAPDERRRVFEASSVSQLYDPA